MQNTLFYVKIMSGTFWNSIPTKNAALHSRNLLITMHVLLHLPFHFLSDAGIDSLAVVSQSCHKWHRSNSLPVNPPWCHKGHWWFSQEILWDRCWLCPLRHPFFFFTPSTKAEGCKHRAKCSVFLSLVFLYNILKKKNIKNCAGLSHFLICWPCCHIDFRPSSQSIHWGSLLI